MGAVESSRQHGVGLVLSQATFGFPGSWLAELGLDTPHRLLVVRGRTGLGIGGVPPPCLRASWGLVAGMRGGYRLLTMASVHECVTGDGCSDGGGEWGWSGLL